MGTGAVRAPTSARPAGEHRSGVFLSKDTAADPRLLRTASFRRESEQQAAGISLGLGADVLRLGGHLQRRPRPPKKLQVRAAALPCTLVCVHTHSSVRVHTVTQDSPDAFKNMTSSPRNRGCDVIGRWTQPVRAAGGGGALLVVLWAPGAHLA